MYVPQTSEMDDSYTSDLAMGEYMRTRSKILDFSQDLDFIRPNSRGSDTDKHILQNPAGKSSMKSMWKPSSPPKLDPILTQGFISASKDLINDKLNEPTEELTMLNTAISDDITINKNGAANPWTNDSGYGILNRQIYL